MSLIKVGLLVAGVYFLFTMPIVAGAIALVAIAWALLTRLPPQT